MASTVVEKPLSPLDKIMSFVNDAGYKELMQNTARYNVRIRKDRIYRQPYIDGQTGVAQRHCHLFLSGKERMPGILQGQVYTYPARRWKATRKSYLTSFFQGSSSTPGIKIDPDEHTITTVENPAAIPVASEEGSQDAWNFFEENTYEDELDDEFESEDDCDDETYNRKGNSKKKKTPSRKSKRGKKKIPLRAPPTKLTKVIQKVEDDVTGKPYVCDLCGMRYKTRPGLTYHLSHSHKEEATKEVKNSTMLTSKSTENSQDSESLPPQSSFYNTVPENNYSSWMETFGGGRNTSRPPSSSLPPQQPSGMHSTTTPIGVNVDLGAQTNMTSSSTSVSSSPVPHTIPSSQPGLPVSGPPLPDKMACKKRAVPSIYCDYCLGDSTENKKTGQAERLISCADCGRSGHPTCLQFTPNIMKSVFQYPWQCIECKTCTLCGTSENDDQLLFCDDCDRGFHLYCLNPPLVEPPEGEWSCHLCIREFHNQ